VKEFLILLFVALNSLLILGYSIHMFIGGLVEQETEIWAIAIACTIGLIVIVLLGFDIIKQRRKH
jgi:Mn2+/Fe2+ NRAMP family transporter